LVFSPGNSVERVLQEAWYGEVIFGGNDEDAVGTPNPLSQHRYFGRKAAGKDISVNPEGSLLIALFG
jgi:hypothetical protein